MAILETIAATAQIGSSLFQVGSGIADIFSGDSGEGKIQLTPEMEFEQLQLFSGFLEELSNNIEQTRELIPFMEDRLNTLDEMARGAQPTPEQIQNLNKIDQDIAQRFGQEIARDVQTGIITEEAKRQSVQLQKDLAAELAAQGKDLTPELVSDIQEAIRSRLDPSSPEATAINEVRNALLDTVRKEGDVLTRDPRVERELAEGRRKLNEDLAKRGIDPESTAGRRATQAFEQRATETRFSTSEQYATNKLARLSTAASGIIGAVGAGDDARTRALQQAIGTQDLISKRFQTFQERAGAIGAPVQSAILAGEPDRLREAQNVTRAGVALGATNQQRTAFNQGLSNMSNLLQLRQLPEQLRGSILEKQGAGLKAFASFGNQKFSKQTRKLLQNREFDAFSSLETPGEAGSRIEALSKSGQLTQEKLDEISQRLTAPKRV